MPQSNESLLDVSVPNVTWKSDKPEDVCITLEAPPPRLTVRPLTYEHRRQFDATPPSLTRSLIENLLIVTFGLLILGIFVLLWNALADEVHVSGIDLGLASGSPTNGPLGDESNAPMFGLPN